MEVESVKYDGEEIRKRVVPKNFYQFLVDCFYQILSDITKKPTQYTLKGDTVCFNRTPENLSNVEITWSEII